MSYEEKLKSYNRTKKKNAIKKMLLIFFFLILPTTLFGYQYYNDDIRIPNIIKQAKIDAKDIKHKEINENGFIIQSISNELENINEGSNTPFSLDNPDNKRVYNETGITFDFNQVRELGNIPNEASINRNLLRGQILIPSVNINLPILEGVSNENLWLGAGTMKPNQQMGKGNFALAGHLMSDPTLLFSPLTSVKKNAYAYITDKNMVYQYKVYDMGYIPINQVDIIKNVNDSKILTLVTCSDLEGNGRYYVRARLNETKSINEVNSEIYSHFRR
ncbi:sortase [Macrococcus armenti]|uniref:sortase family protein n=1 Tax=Macrococcus armenti TaxID=2875764 RepID=UPI001CC93AA5|nr:sortase [Macrococcus armenti]UBH16576.1 sortase [Macrococcus armenti]UBH21211.1 sortase [Macrococcus armenti]